MALFAGDNPIMTGDELTYDYNFDPFSAKNVQECRCGSDNCRGVLGPKPKDQKPIKDTIKDTVKATVKAGKRKLKELLGGDDEDLDSDSRSPKKRKLKEAKGVKRSSSSTSMRMAKGAEAIKKSVSTQLFNARKAVSAKRGAVVMVRKTTKAKISKTYGKGHSGSFSRNSSLTIVAEDTSPHNGNAKARSSLTKNVVRSMAGRRRDSASRSNSESTIRVITN